jgi:hypothetical protein
MRPIYAHAVDSRSSPWIVGAHTRPKGIARPVAAINHKEHQAEIRTGIPTAEVAAILRRAWDASQDGRRSPWPSISPG